MARQTPYPVSLQCLIFLLFLLVTFLLVSGVVLTFLYFPHPPKFQVVSFQVSPIILTPLDGSFYLMCATWNLTFVARNPNKRLQLSYNNVDVSLYYKWIYLSSQRAQFFILQREKSDDFLHATVVTDSTILSRVVVEAMEKDVDDDFSVNFNVKLRGTVRVYAQSLLRMNGKHSLSINCDDVKVDFFPYNGTGLMMMAATATKACYNTKLIF